MKRLISKYLLFLSIGFLVLCGICGGIMKYPNVFDAGYFNRWFSTYQVISRSNHNIDSDTLYLGDSVAGQIYRPEERKNYLAYTAAILMPGYYMLAANAIKSNPNIKSIVLISGPLTIGYEFEQYTTYSYFIKPFYLKKNFLYFTKNLQSKIDQYTYSSFFQYPIVKLAPFSDIDCSKDGTPNNNYMLSDISLEYLIKLQQLCKENNIELRLLSAPIMDTYISKTNDWQHLRQQIKKEGLENLFKGFFESIKYLEEESFIDGFHIETKYINESKAHLKKHLQIATK